ncbi:hypothetical protein ES708_25193 [subsurface metagenome]
MIIEDFADFTYEVKAGEPVVVVNWAKLCERLKKNLVKKNMNIKIYIDYVEK